MDNLSIKEMKQTSITVLQEYSQKNRKSPPVYTLIDRVGPDHAIYFTIRVTYDSLSAEGTEKTKKSAKHKAASEMLKLLGLIDMCEKHKISEEGSEFQEIKDKNHTNISKSTNSIGELQELCQQYRLKTPIYEECNTNSQNCFKIRCIWGKIIKEATASSKKEAKQNAAELMNQYLLDNHFINNSQLTKDSFSSNVDTEISVLANENLHHLSQLPTKIAKELFPKLKQNIGISVKINQTNLSEFHKIFRNSFDSDKIQSFYTYFHSLKFDELEVTIDFLKNILDRVSQILDIRATRTLLKTVDNKNFAVSYNFNTTPIFREIGFGKSIETAEQAAIIRAIRAINLLLI